MTRTENGINGTKLQPHEDNTYNERPKTIATLPYNRIPLEMRIPYILSGYRQTHQPWRYYFASIFHIHNETLNVWTHLIGSVIIIYHIYTYFRIYEAAGSDLRWTVLYYGICGLSALMFSSIAHLLHSKSRHTNYVVFLFDYLGCSFWVYGTGIMTVYGVSDPTIYTLVKDHYLKWQCFCTVINYVNICAAKLWYGNDIGNPRRTLMTVGGIGGQFALNSVPFSWRYYTCVVDKECHISSLNHITTFLVMFVLVALLFSWRQPERTWPGRFDIVGGSHQLFHIAVILAQISEMSALYTDFQTGANHHCHPNVREIQAEIGTIAVIGLFILLRFKTLAYSHLKDS